jgi:FtsZ-binding cell division protein ZapB
MGRCAAFSILRVAKLKTMGSIAGSGRHTFREVETPNADTSRLHLNGNFGSRDTAGLLAAVRDRLPDKRRKDAVLALEYMISASPEWFGKDWRTKPKGYRPEYFQEALAWLQAKHGSENVIAGQVHLDEKTPHMCVFVVPRTPDGRLSAKEFTGGRAKLNKMQTDFHNSVGVKHGLERGVEGSKAAHTAIKQFYAKMDANTTFKLPEAPPEASVMEVASGRAAKNLKNYAVHLAEVAATAETAAQIARLSFAARQGQAKAIARLRVEVADADQLKGRTNSLQNELTGTKHQLEAKEKENAQLKADLRKAEQVITNQSAKLAEYRRQNAAERDHSGPELK